MKISDLISNALIELGVLAAGQTVSADHSSFCLNKLNRLFDNWNADGDYIYATTLFRGTLTPNHSPHTIGITGLTPAADLVVSVTRPQKIDYANLILTDVTPNIHRKLTIKDDAWWMSNPIPDLATQIPYDLWPNYSWPLAQLYLWPVPTKAYDIEINLWTSLASVALTDTFTMPPGYEDAVTMSLAESLVSAFPSAPGAQTAALQAAQARGRIKALNSESPTMVCDGAAQSIDSRPTATIANFLSGFFN